MHSLFLQSLPLKRMSEMSSSVLHIHEVKANYMEGKKVRMSAAYFVFLMMMMMMKMMMICGAWICPYCNSMLIVVPPIPPHKKKRKKKGKKNQNVIGAQFWTNLIFWEQEGPQVFLESLRAGPENVPTPKCFLLFPLSALGAWRQGWSVFFSFKARYLRIPSSNLLLCEGLGHLAFFLSLAASVMKFPHWARKRTAPLLIVFFMFSTVYSLLL